MKIKIKRPGTQLSAARYFAFFLLFVCANVPVVARANDTLTNAAAVLALSADEALPGIPVTVTGVVTAAQTNWSGQFFVQDASGGVFVDNRGGPRPVPGDRVEVSGSSHPGGYAPIISKPHWKKLGTAPLPEARPVTIERLMSGAEDSQRVEISGIVRTAQFSSGNTIGVELVSGGYRLRAYFTFVPDLDPQSLVGAKVLVRGTAATAYDSAQLRHLLTVTLFIPRPADFIIEEPAPASPFDAPVIPLNGIAQYRMDRSPGNQVHVKGVVTYQRKGEDLFLQDAIGGLQVKTKTPESVSPGDVVEAVGFPAVENFLPVLEDAVFRKTTDPRANLEPTNTTVADLQKGLHHADFIMLQGRLLDRLMRGIGKNAAGPGIQTTLVLQTSNFIFVAEKDTSEPNSFLTAIPIGSLVEVRGVCLLETGDDGKIKSFRVLLPTSHDVRIIEKPGWLTPQHLLASLVVVFIILLVAVGWTVLVAKKNSVLKSLVQEKETAQRELQEAHDQLEERVRERTAQLKVEMTARKETELQFRAVLTERTRLAQELHDTLEQTLTGIALQQDMVANQFEKNPDSATHHLKLARSLMRQSQVDLRRSVWGLRSRAEEQFNLTSALTTSVRQITGDTGIRIEIETAGEAGPVSEIIEENLLRIGQEAVTNIVKHSGAALVKIELQFNPRHVVLQIHDDGKGFNPEACAGPKDGHFGLLGIRERTERLGGQILITSEPGGGTSVRVEIPTHPTNGHQPLPPPGKDHEERI
jgi:signal transduction histidine kinase